MATVSFAAPLLLSESDQQHFYAQVLKTLTE
jgi:hypothetical protein